MYNIEDIPDVLVAMAYGAKNIDKVPVFGNKGAWVFRALFSTEEGERVINSLIASHPEPKIYKMALERELS